MKTKSTPKKKADLKLRKETLRRLTPAELGQVGGGVEEATLETISGITSVD